MYTVYADGVCIYDDVSPSDEVKLINPTLIMERNAAGSFEATLPPINVGYESINLMTSEIIVKRRGNEIWSGRCISDSYDWNNNRKIYVEGELAYLNDSIQPQREYASTTHGGNPWSVRDFLEALLIIHNNQVGNEYNKKFFVGTVEEGIDPNDAVYRYTNYENTLECINTKLLEGLDCYIKITKENNVRYISLCKTPTACNQTIKFGENLLDFAKDTSVEEFCSKVIPLGKDINDIGDGTEDLDATESDTPANFTEYLTIEELEGPSYPRKCDDIAVQNQNGVTSYGSITKIVHFDDCELAENLYTKGCEYLDAIQFKQLSLEVTAADLNYLDLSIDNFDLNDNVRCYAPYHGMVGTDGYGVWFPVTKMKIPLNNPDKSSITLNDSIKQSLTARSNQINQELLDDVENIPSQSSTLKKAFNNSWKMLSAGGDDSYIYFEKSRDGKTIKQMYMMNSSSLETATHYWLFNQAGIGHWKKNNGQWIADSPTYELDGTNVNVAITMDGKIVADAVTTGTMTAERVRGGNLEVGGNGLGASGSITIKNNQGETLITLDKNGIKFSNGEKINASDINGLPVGVNTIQTLYYLGNSTTKPSKPSSKVTETSNNYNTWSNNSVPSGLTSSITTWTSGTSYTLNKVVKYNGYFYKCIAQHTSATSNRPGSGTNWKNCWELQTYRYWYCAQYISDDGNASWSDVSEYNTESTTVITQNSITTSFINALKVKAGSVDCEDLTGVTISGKTINAETGRVNIIGNGYLHMTTQEWESEHDYHHTWDIGPKYMNCLYEEDDEYHWVGGGRQLVYKVIQGALGLSDRRVKDKIVDLDIEFSKSLINKTKTHEFVFNYDSKRYAFGVIAQEVKDLLDELGYDKKCNLVKVETDPNEMWWVDYRQYVPHLINCIQDLEKRVSYLENQNRR